MLPFRGFLGRKALESMDFSKPRSKRTATVAACLFIVFCDGGASVSSPPKRAAVKQMSLLSENCRGGH